MADQPHGFRCFDCRTPAFLIRGRCGRCAPELHRQHAERLEAVGQAMARFEAATGRSPFEDWYAFETWLA